MSEALATTGTVRKAPTLTREQVLAFVEDPLKQLPDDWRLPVWDFWAYFQDMLPSQLSLCTRLRRWRDTESLTLPELVRVMDDLRSFERSAEFQFGTQVLAALAEQIKANRKADADRRRSEEGAAKYAGCAAPPPDGTQEQWRQTVGKLADAWGSK